MNEWFRRNSNYLAKTKQEDKEALFLSGKSKIMAELSSSTHKKELLQKLQMAMTTSKEDKDHKDSVESSQNFTPLNEDDYYGIDGVPELQ